MLNPPITRMGGKSRLRKTIISLIPEHICYVELFFGAGWVYFGKDPSEVEVINDIDKELINLFRMIKYHAPEVERMLEYEFSGRDIFEEYKNCTVGYLTEIHRAVFMFNHPKFWWERRYLWLWNFDKAVAAYFLYRCPEPIKGAA